MTVVLSASSVGAYQSCEYRWYLEYVERQQGEQSVARAVGIAVHAGIEDYFKTDGDEESALSTYQLTYLLETAAIADPELDIAKTRLVGGRVLKSYIEDVAPDVGVPIMVEQAAQFDVNDIPFSVHIDLVDEYEAVRDTKIKGAKPRYPDQYAFAQVGYALAYRFMTGRVESDLQIDVMIRLKVKRPYHVPISNGGPATDHDIRLFADKLEQVAEGIARSRFRPTGLEKGICKWCPVASVCEYKGELDATTTTDDDDLAGALIDPDIGAH